MNIRLLEAPGDTEAFRAIRIESPKDAPVSFRGTEEEMRAQPIEEFEKQLDDEMVDFIGAFQDDELVGVAALIYERSQKLSHKASIGAVFVSPTYRNQGIGRALIMDLIDRAERDEKLKQLNLGVTTTNRTAVKLYEDLGFSIFGTEKNAAYVDGVFYDEHHMQHVLSPS